MKKSTWCIPTSLYVLLVAGAASAIVAFVAGATSFGLVIIATMLMLCVMAAMSARVGGTRILQGRSEFDFAAGATVALGRPSAGKAFVLVRYNNPVGKRGSVGIVNAAGRLVIGTRTTTLLAAAVRPSSSSVADQIASIVAMTKQQRQVLLASMPRFSPPGSASYF